MSAPPLAPADLELVLSNTELLWDEMRGQRLFITGGTGFFGCWLLESFAWANKTLGLQAEVVALTRDPAAFALKCPHLAADPSITLLAGDVRNFTPPEGDFPFVIHAATEASARQSAEEPLEMLTTILDGTRRVLDFASARSTRKLLLTSSGAVYGRQPTTVSHLPEEYLGAPDPLDPASVYGEGKRMSEQMCALHAQATGMEIKIARCFAFAGPHLPLDTHFAIGNFIRNAMAGEPISISGDGTPLRSYLYAADLATWLWTILFRAPSLRAFNVGSEASLSIADLARTVTRFLHPQLPITVAKTPIQGAAPPRYVPQTTRAQKELQLSQTVSLEESILRTAEWYRTRAQK